MKSDRTTSKFLKVALLRYKEIDGSIVQNFPRISGASSSKILHRTQRLQLISNMEIYIGNLNECDQCEHLIRTAPMK